MQLYKKSSAKEFLSDLSGCLFFGEDLFGAGDSDTKCEDIHGCLQIRQRRECRCDTDVGIVGILTVGPSGAGRGHDHACLLAAGDDILRAAAQGIEHDEVAAQRVCPCAHAQSAKISFQGAGDDLELGTDDVGVLSHMLNHAVDVAEESDMSELVDLVVADGLMP